MDPIDFYFFINVSSVYTCPLETRTAGGSVEIRVLLIEGGVKP